jgi:small GTP-binding protein
MVSIDFSESATLHFFVSLSCLKSRNKSKKPLRFAKRRTTEARTRIKNINMEGAFKELYVRAVAKKRAREESEELERAREVMGGISVAIEDTEFLGERKGNKSKILRFAWILDMDHDFVFKVVVTGDPCVGKTALLNRYVDQIFSPEHFTTIGVDFKTKTIATYVNGIQKVLKLQVWDTAGQERFRAVTKAYYRGSAAIIFVYAINDMKSFENLKHWIESVDELKIEYRIIIGNKSDLAREREVPHLTAMTYAKEHGFLYLETSALTGSNVDELFKSIAQNLAERYSNATYADKGGVDLSREEREEPKGTKCCGGTG